MAMKLGARHAAEPDHAFGAFELRRLDWDTTHFGRKMGVLALAPARVRASEQTMVDDLRLALAEAAADRYEHLILRVGAEQLDVARAAGLCGLRLVDIAPDLAISLSHPPPASLSAGARPATATDLGALHAISQGLCEFSRFSADPFFSADEVAGLYRQWLTNLCGGLANAVLVIQASDEVAGFTSCAVQADGTGRIPLIATSEEHRRQGIGRALIEASLRWFSSAGIKTVWVKTQAANYAALALYTRMGFRIAAMELTFSVILPRGPHAE